MSPAKPKLRVTPELCEGCRAGHYDCERACKQSAIRVGRGFVYVDWERCDGCLACVDMCDAGALQASDAATAGAGASGPAHRIVKPQSPPTAPAAAHAPPGPLGVWTEADGIIALAVMLASLFGLGIVQRLRVVTLMPSSGRVFARAGALAISYAIELVVIWALARRHNVSVARAFGLRPAVRSLKSAAISTGLVLGFLIATRLLTSVYGLITQAFGWEPVVQWDIDLTKVFGAGRVGLVLTIALVVVFGPFVEELTFRGVVQSAARRRWGVATSIIAASALFAVYHFDPWLLAPTFVLGLALGWLAEKRQGLWPSIALHALYNGVTVFAIFWLASQ